MQFGPARAFGARIGGAGDCGVRCADGVLGAFAYGEESAGVGRRLGDVREWLHRQSWSGIIGP